MESRPNKVQTALSSKEITEDFTHIETSKVYAYGKQAQTL